MLLERKHTDEAIADAVIKMKLHSDRKRVLGQISGRRGDINAGRIPGLGDGSRLVRISSKAE